MGDTFQVSKEGGVHLLAGPQLPPKSLCQGSLALRSHRSEPHRLNFMQLTQMP